MKQMYINPASFENIQFAFLEAKKVLQDGKRSTLLDGCISSAAYCLVASAKLFPSSSVANFLKLKM